MLTFFFVLGYLALLMLLGAAVSRLLVPIFGRAWRLFVAPGVIVHELAHVLGCIATGAKVLEINFWKPSGGHVVHTQPQIHIVGPVIVSLAPMIVMTLGLFAIVPLFGNQLESLAWVQHLPTTFSEALGGYIESVFAAFASFNWLNWEPWVLMYVMLNVAVTITPSATDLQNSKWALVGLVILIAFLSQLFTVDFALGAIWPPIATSLVLLGMAVVAALLVALVALVIRRIPDQG